MIPNETPQTVETQGTGIKPVAHFKITDATQARILVSLSDKMYTRKELAVVREYSNNANDAHIVVGKPTSEVVITLPTMEDLTFRVRDFGTGLTEDQIRDVYCILGESTKRNSAEQNGVLGYGCKAGFAHADSFTVTSWVNGVKSVYNCIKGDSTKLHSVIQLSSAPSDEPTGIEIAVPVKQSSLWTFHQEAADFFKHWENLPTINNLVQNHVDRMNNFRSKTATLKGDGWFIRPKTDGSAIGVAFMGGVPYRIDWNVLGSRMSLTAQKRCLFELLQNNDVTFVFKMGEVQFVDSRESLEYTDKTINALMARVDSVFNSIQQSIQEKFDPAENIWEAKKIYNALFGTGLIEVEKGEDADCIDRIKFLDGNLIQIESNFRGTFKWKGIVIDDAGFDYLNRFDNNDTTKTFDKKHTPFAPVLATYRRKKKRAKINRCTAENAHTITASHQVAVVLNDTGVKAGQSLVSRYLIFKPESKIRTVHVLTFKDSTIRDAFFAEYHFDTVPVIKLSEILADAKAWNNANKVPRTYGSGGGGNGTRVLRYMDIENGKVEEDEVPIREIEDGGFFVELAELRRRRWRSSDPSIRLHNGYNSEDARSAVKYIKVLAEQLDLDISRVYIVSETTRGTKWFTEAVNSGDWQNLWKHIKESLPLIDNVQGLVNADDYNRSKTVDPKMAAMLTPKIMDKNSNLLKLIALGSDKDFTAQLEVVTALRELYLWDEVKGDVTGTVDYAKTAEACEASYPYLNIGHLDNEYYANETNVNQIARYVNAMDLFIDLAESVPAPQTAVAEEVETAEVAA